MLRISKHLFGHRNRFYRSANMEISKREKKNIKIIRQIIAFKELFKNVQ